MFKHTFKYLILGSAILALAFYFWVKTLAAPVPQTSAQANLGTDDGHITPLHPEIAQTIRGVLQEGDLVFRGRNHSWGQMGAKLSDKDKRFGHVGVALNQDGVWHVIDAGGHPLADDATVAEAPLNAFLYSAQRAAVYRPNLEASAQHIFIERLEWHAASLTPFDGKFDLATPDTLYCTELVWAALIEATGEDLVSEHTMWKGRRVIALDDLQFANGMAEVISASIDVTKLARRTH